MLLGVIMELVRTEDDDFARNTDNNSVINTNVSSYVAFKRQRANAIKIKEQQDELTGMRTEIAELKELVKLLVDKQNG